MKVWRRVPRYKTEMHQVTNENHSIIQNMGEEERSSRFMRNFFAEKHQLPRHLREYKSRLPQNQIKQFENIQIEANNLSKNNMQVINSLLKLLKQQTKDTHHQNSYYNPNKKNFKPTSKTNDSLQQNSRQLHNDIQSYQQIKLTHKSVNKSNYQKEKVNQLYQQQEKKPRTDLNKWWQRRETNKQIYHQHTKDEKKRVTQNIRENKQEENQFDDRFYKQQNNKPNNKNNKIHNEPIRINPLHNNILNMNEFMEGTNNPSTNKHSRVPAIRTRKIYSQKKNRQKNKEPTIKGEIDAMQLTFYKPKN